MRHWVDAMNDDEWNAAIEAAAKQAEDRNVLGYIADFGCWHCFERIAAAIRALKRSPK